MYISPDDGFKRPASVFISVDLPEPFGPITVITFPFSRSKLMPFRISPEPYPAFRLLDEKKDFNESKPFQGMPSLPLHWQ